jgi:hypothetical protein
VAHGKKPQPGSAEEKEQRQYLDEALAILRQAVAAGFRDARQLQSDPSFEPLRVRPDFLRLQSELATNPRP